MKVLMISKACYVAAYRRKLEEMVASADLDLTLLVPPYWRTGKKKALFEEGFQTGYSIILDNPIWNGQHHLHFYPKLAAHLRQIKPDIVHIDEEPYDFIAFHAAMLAAQAGAKVVFFTWQNLYRRFPPPFAIFERYVLGHSDAAIAGNREAADILVRKGFQHEVAYIPQFGVDPEAFSRMATPNSARRKGEPLRIGYAGRLVPEKGILDLVRAVANLKGRWELLILGDGPQKDEILNTIKQMKIEKRVRFLEPIPSTEMAAFYSGIDVFVLPSLTTTRWKEQFGRVLIEAMACEVVVVGSDSGEIPNVIGDAGLVFPEGDANQLTARLQSLLDDPSRRNNLATAGRHRVLQQFTHAKIARDTCELYQRMHTG